MMRMRQAFSPFFLETCPAGLADAWSSPKKLTMTPPRRDLSQGFHGSTGGNATRAGEAAKTATCFRFTQLEKACSLFLSSHLAVGVCYGIRPEKMGKLL